MVDGQVKTGTISVEEALHFVTGFESGQIDVPGDSTDDFDLMLQRLYSVSTKVNSSRAT